MTSSKRILPLLLALCLLLSGCRSSPILVQEVYQQDVEEVDEDQEMLDPEDEGQEDDDFSNETVEDLDTLRDTENNEGIFNESDTGSAESAADVEYNENANLDDYASKTPTASPQPSATPTQTPQEPPETTQNPEEDANAADQPQDDNSGNEAEDEPQNQPEQPDQPAPTRQITDASGAVVDIPENVERVTAVGAAAQMVEMVGGSGRLLAADSALLSSALAQAAFSDIYEINSWWSGTGNSGMDDGCFSALLDAAPDACLVISGQSTFSDDQIAQLSYAGIACVTLYPLSSIDNLESSVRIVAQVMGTHTDGSDSAGIADSYCAWVDSLVSGVGSRTSGYNLTSLYLVGWDDSAEYALSNTNGCIPETTPGLAYAYSPAKYQMVSNCMSKANVINESTRIGSLHRSSNYVYVTPMFHQFSASVTGSRAAYYSGGGEYGSAYDLFVARQISDSSYYQLGHSQFPAVIVASDGVKSAIENNWFWQYHETNSNGYVSINGGDFYCGIVGNYNIYVNPQGMCSWAEGSVESPLEAMWVACKFMDAYSLEDVKAETNSFYARFFGVSLSGDQLYQIFGE